jgi:putative ABC transport system substrate-binding protein
VQRRTFVQQVGRLLLAGGGVATLDGCGRPLFGAPVRVARVGVLAANQPDTGRWQAFMEEMSRRGWILGQNLTVEWAIANPGGRNDLLPDLAADLLHRNVDVIVTGESPAVMAAKRLSTTTPIVMTGTGDPVGAGLIDSLSHPGGRVTGVSQNTAELGAKRLAILKEVLPGATLVLLVLNGSNPSNLQAVPGRRRIAEALGIRLAVLDVHSTDTDLIQALARAAPGGADGLAVEADTLFLVPLRTRLVKLAAQARLPAIYFSREFVDAGGLMAYGPNLISLYRRAAYFVDLLLNGRNSADLPVEQPTVFEFVVNRTTLQSLGLELPQTLLPLVTDWVV